MNDLEIISPKEIYINIHKNITHLIIQFDDTFIKIKIDKIINLLEQLLD